MEATAKRAREPESCGGQDWIEQELAASTLPDARLEKRLRHLVEQLAKGAGRSIPWVCQVGRPPRRPTGFSPTIESVLEIRYRRMRLRTPKGKKKRYPELMVTVIEAREQETPPDRDRIDWKLITDLTVRTRRQTVEKVQ